MERSIQFLASEIQAVRSQEVKSKEAASAHMLSCKTIYTGSVANDIFFRHTLNKHTMCNLNKAWAC